MWAFELLRTVFIWWGIISLLLIIAGVVLSAVDLGELTIVGLVSGIIWGVVGLVYVVFYIIVWAFSTVCGITMAVAVAVIIIIIFLYIIISGMLSG